MAERKFPSSLTDRQWEIIRKFLPLARAGGRPRKTDLRNVLDAVYYLMRSGCAWRYLPPEFPPWPTVYYYFRHWERSGLWKNVHDFLRDEVRVQLGRESAPSTLIVDSQTVKAARGLGRGYSGFKGIRGRKRHVLVDTLGFLHAVSIQPANLNDTVSGHELFSKDFRKERMERILADQGYRGTFVRKSIEQLGIKPIIPESIEPTGQGRKKLSREKLSNRRLKGSKKGRWIVERTFAWLNHFRRLSRDYEFLPLVSECGLYIVMSLIMLKRLLNS